MNEMLTPAPSKPLLPWILLTMVAVVSIGAVLVEKQKGDSSALRAADAVAAEVKAKAEAAEATAAKKSLEQRVQELQTENTRLSVKVAEHGKLAMADKTDKGDPAKAAGKKARAKRHKHR